MQGANDTWQSKGSSRTLKLFPTFMLGGDKIQLRIEFMVNDAINFDWLQL